MKIMSYNIKVGAKTPERMDAVLDTIRRHDPDTIGLQEACVKWYNFLLENLSDVYGFAGMGRDSDLNEDGTLLENKGEACFVMYKKDKYRLVDTQTTWLTSTPYERSKIEPDQKYRRVITKAVLEEKATGKQFVAFSIHTNGEHYGLQEINYAMERVLPVLDTGLPTYFTGDFNVLPSSDTYALIAQHMNDARMIAKSYGNNGVTTTVSRRIIDFIWCSKDNITVEKFDVLDEPIYPMGWVEKYASDHLAVVAEINF